MAPLTAEKIRALRASQAVKQIPRDYDRHLDKIAAAFEEEREADLIRSDLIDNLEPSTDTLPYLHVLFAHINAAVSPKGVSQTLRPGGSLWLKLARFLTTCDSIEIRFGGTKWRKLVEILGETSRYLHADDRTEPVPVLPVMVAAMQRMDPSLATLTSNHLHLINLSFSTQSPSPSLVVLDKDLHTTFARASTNQESQPPLSIPHLSSTSYILPSLGLTERMTLDLVQQYYMNGALIYIVTRNWSRAAFFLEHVLSTPAKENANYLMVEAYKKWVLVKLLLHGTVPQPPPNLSSATLKSIKSLSKPYDTLAEDFESADDRKIGADSHEGAKIWTQDDNTGLVQSVLQAHRKRKVTRLEKVYTALPLPLVADRLELSDNDAEQYLRGLISNGSLEATLDGTASQDGSLILTFPAGRDSNVSIEAEERKLHGSLVNQTLRIKELANHIEEVDRRLGLTKEYVDHWRNVRNKWEDRAMPEEETVGDMPFDQGPSDDDENDVMKDM